ncbi:MAG: uroporphyrinogen-III synthase [Oleiphilaceae bacterium]|nr:uroporphyrinogen-III synthase [Oleiphilaceae bacterium]
MEDQPLAGLRIAIPETRQLDVLAQMLERRGATTWRCPLVSILDSPDSDAVEQWLRRFNQGHMDQLVLMTGEGLRRLVGFAERAGLRDEFVERLGRVPVITRGPKPGNALRELGLRPTELASQPTTEGMIETLSRHDLEGLTVGVQLYGEEPNYRLTDFITARGAEVLTVAPYVYASETDDAQVQSLIRGIVDGRLDAVAFTSQPQVRRLLKVGAAMEADEALLEALNRMTVIAVGPVVRDRLEESGITVDVMPEESYFMKPMVRALIERIRPQASAGGD